ncbi:hypothetical protein [Streptomyces sp. B6B3]|uniref:hypothetical protein n=1 Tax=Streptomyces sp. B6B3 TaxID=3153570 RepID=UPI00325E95E9
MSPAPTTPAPAATRSRRLAYYALLVCALTVAAAVVSFVRGNMLGVIWVLLAGLSSNIAWYYFRRSRPAGRAGDA